MARGAVSFSYRLSAIGQLLKRTRHGACGAGRNGTTPQNFTILLKIPPSRSAASPNHVHSGS